MIWYDNTRMFKSVSYYVQQMYSTNKGTNVLKLTMNGQPVAGQEGQNGLFASSVLDKNEGTIIVKVVNTSKTPQNVSINLNGLKGELAAETITLTYNDMDAENTLDTPNRIVPTKGKLTCAAGKKNTVINDQLPAMAFRIYKVKK